MRLIKELHTEQLNNQSADLDQLSSYHIVRLMNAEDQHVPLAVSRELEDVAAAVDLITSALEQGGRLIYAGAGTSGRLALLDAAECPPTFGTSPDLIFGLLAGGNAAFFQAIEGAEDDAKAGGDDLQRVHLASADVVVGVSASGRTPYVFGALTYAKRIGAKTITLSCNKNSQISTMADVSIEVETGAEVVGGSTRLKAGTAQKMVLNMLSTASMVRLGKVYKNLMVDVKPSNEKLLDRACRTIVQVTGLDYDRALQTLKDANYELKTALVMAKHGISMAEAKHRLEATKGFLKPLLETAEQAQ